MRRVPGSTSRLAGESRKEAPCQRRLPDPPVARHVAVSGLVGRVQPGKRSLIVRRPGSVGRGAEALARAGAARRCSGRASFGRALDTGCPVRWGSHNDAMTKNDPMGVLRRRVAAIVGVVQGRRGCLSLFIAVLGLVAACRSTPGGVPGPAAPLRLAFLHDFNPAGAGSKAKGPLAPAWGASALGGLSGLYYAASSRTLFAVSDNCSQGPARIYACDVELSASQFVVEPRSVLLLRDVRSSGSFDLCDSESITPDAAGGFFIGTENHDDNPDMRWPSILRVASDGAITGVLPLPEAFLPESAGAHTSGTRDNLAFEGLSVSPSGRWLTAMTEVALQQDGPPATFEHGTIVRVLRWDLAAQDPPTEFRYATEPVPRPANGEAEVQLNGVSELLSLDDQRVLVLERAYVAPARGLPGTNTIRIFETALPAGSPPPAPAASPPLLSKRLVLDLDDILAQLEPGKQTLDNFEGMTFGPRLASGERTLLLVTDDNFRAAQRIVFLAFRIME
jgi:hypothetical protein